jgi:tetratricopeptide (TPR) repeat protein
VERSLALEPDLAEAHGQMGWIRMGYDWDWRGAEASFSRALTLAPGNALVLRGAGVLAVNLGRLEEAIGLFRRAVEQDPLSATTYGNLGVALQTANHFMEAEEAYRKALKLAARRSGTRAYLSLSLLAQGRGEEALAEAGREPEESLRLWSLAIVHHAMGHGAESGANLRQLITTYGEGSAYQVGEAYGARGETDAAFEWLERAYALRDTGLTEIKTSLNLRPLHGDPRWGAFLRKMGFEE